jgi:hypothetical protein
MVPVATMKSFSSPQSDVLDFAILFSLLIFQLILTGQLLKHLAIQNEKKS